MAKLKIPRGLYLQARVRADGQLVFRWGHAPGLRAQGVRPFDLYADGRPLSAAALAAQGLPAGITPPETEDGRPLLHEGRQRPLALKEAVAAATALTATLKTPDAISAPAAPRSARPAAPAPAGVLTVGALLDLFLDPRNARFADGSPDTLRSYRSWRAPVDEVFQHEPCTALTEDLIREWFDVTRAARGHRMAYGGYQLLRAAWRWCPVRYRLPVIEWQKVRPPKPPAKLRIASQGELEALLAAMDDPAAFAASLPAHKRPNLLPPARPELGDSLVLAIWTVQRARDVIGWTGDTLRAGRFRFIASKNGRQSGRRMDIPVVGEILPARLAAMAARRAARGATCPNLILDPDQDRPYAQKAHGKHFREARALASIAAPSLAGLGLDDWQQPFTTFTFEDCRDTGITRLLRAGCSIEQVASWSNHSDINALRALAESYMDFTGEVADAAGDKLALYAGSKGFRI